MNKNRLRKTIQVSKETIDKILKTVKEYLPFTLGKAPQRNWVGAMVYIDDNPTNITVTGRCVLDCHKLISYVYAKDDRDIKKHKRPGDCYREMNREAHIPDIVKADPAFHDYTASPFQDSISSQRNRERMLYKDVICYDTNLTYFYLLNRQFPDVNKPQGFGVVEKGQVGFKISPKKIIGSDGRVRNCLTMVPEGRLADFRYPLTENMPFESYVQKKLQALKDHPEDRGEIKNQIVVSVGVMAHHNPIWRAFIVETANQRIKSLMDENSIYCNTDCIISTVPRPDIPISTLPGDFKIEEQGDVVIEGQNLFWKSGKVSQRGCHSESIKYYLDTETLELKEITK